MSSNDILRGTERDRGQDGDKERERSCQHLCSSRTVRGVRSHAPSLPFLFLFARPPPPKKPVFHHSAWFHTPRPNIRVDMNRKEKHGIVFPRTIVSTVVICVMLSSGVSRPLSLGDAWLPSFHQAESITERNSVSVCVSLSQDSHFGSAQVVSPTVCKYC